MMTLDGTNTWVLREPGASASVVVDPGPVEDGHLERWSTRPGDVGLVLLTHHHFDHSEVAPTFAERKGCAVRALDPALLLRRRAARRRRGRRGRRSRRSGSSPRPATPPTRCRSCCPPSGVLLTGRHGARPRHDRRRPPRRPARRPTSTRSSGCARWSPPARSPPSGPPTARCSTTPAASSTSTSPTAASGWPRSRPPSRSSATAAPRGLAEDELPRQVVEIVYADVDESLWGAAELSVRAQLAYLAELG